MADGSRPLAVSGEIMTEPSQDAAGCAPSEVEMAGDVIDAEYFTLASEPRRGGPKPHETLSSISSPAAPPMAGMDMLRRPAETIAPRKPTRGGPLFWAAGLGFAAAAFWISGGHALVRGTPFIGTEAPHGALSISGVTSRVDGSGAHPVLFVDGETANDGSAIAHLPPLEIAVTGNDGVVTRYRLGTSGRPMAPGETFAFSSRLDVPKNGVKTVSVTFAE
jgi:hypothetical protein